MRFRTLRASRGRRAEAGSYVLIHYTARLPSGEVLDTSRTPPTEPASAGVTPQTDPASAGASSPASETPAEAGSAWEDPIGFVLWSGQVMRGWDLGIAGMRVGEIRELHIPIPLTEVLDPPVEAPDDPTAPPHDLPTDLPTLIFEIELIDVLPGVLHHTTEPAPDQDDDPQLAAPGDRVVIHYVASVHGQPQPFDDSRTRSEDGFAFRLGSGAVIQGLDLGVRGMAPGEHRTLVIPPYLAYGQRGIADLIPPGATLRYEVELLDIRE